MESSSNWRSAEPCYPIQNFSEGIQPSIVDQIEDVILGFKKSRRFAILLVEQGLHFAARLAEKYVVMAKGAVVAAAKSDELSAEMVRQHLTV